MIEDILRRQSGGKIGYYAPGETMTAEKPPFFFLFCAECVHPLHGDVRGNFSWLCFTIELVLLVN